MTQEKLYRLNENDLLAIIAVSQKIAFGNEGQLGEDLLPKIITLAANMDMSHAASLPAGPESPATPDAQPAPREAVEGSVELFKQIWYSRNPAHDIDPNGVDMFWQTAELVARDYASRLASQPSLAPKGADSAGRWVKASEKKWPNNGDEVLFKYKGIKHFGYYESVEGSEFFSTASGISAHRDEIDCWLDESPSFTSTEKAEALEREGREDERELSGEWTEYNHDYEKRIQDIRTKDGKEHIECWPNAGNWNVLTSKDGLQIPDAEVTHTRLNEQEL